MHYNTPELTEACIMSVRKHGGQDYHVTIFDNSNDRPFTEKMDGVKVIDNTKGQVIDFDKELAKFKNKCPEIGCAQGNNYGSVKHMMTIQKLWDILPDGFLLMDPDILLQKPVDFMFQEDRLCVGHIQVKSFYPKGMERLVPFLLWINVPMCREYGIRFFDPKRCWAIHSKKKEDYNNWYDTGASLLEDVRKCEAKGRRIDIRPLMIHYQGASWRRNGLLEQIDWLMKHANLWMPAKFSRPKSKKMALVAVGRLENKYAKEWVDHHLKAGFDKIYIYDNNYIGEEHFEDVLKTAIAKKKVEIIDWRNMDHQQNAAYRDWYEHHKHDYAWAAFFDFDEFLQVDDVECLHNVLDCVDAAVVKVNWECYGDNNLIKADKKKVQARFTTPIANDVNVKDPHGDNYLVKSFVRGGLPFAIWRNPHCPKVPGSYAYIDGTKTDGTAIHQPDYTVARLKHYVTKTIEEWMTLKVVRGEGCCKANTDDLRQNAVDIFFRYNERTPEKEAWLEKHGFIGKPEA